MQVCIAVLHDRISEGKEESMFFYYFDRYYWILIVPALLFAIWAQSRVSTTYRKYSQVRSARGMTAAQVCRQILDENGLFQIRIERVAGNLTDHYDPRAMSSACRTRCTTAHRWRPSAWRRTRRATPCSTRWDMSPSASAARSSRSASLAPRSRCRCCWWACCFNYGFLVQLGIVLFSTVALFQLVTLPVEFNASARALRTLESSYILESDEVKMAGKVLRAAALTYVAALLSSLAQLLRLILLFGRRDRINI